MWKHPFFAQNFTHGFAHAVAHPAGSVFGLCNTHGKLRGDGSIGHPINDVQAKSQRIIWAAALISVSNGD